MSSRFVSLGLGSWLVFGFVAFLSISVSMDFVYLKRYSFLLCFILSKMKIGNFYFRKLTLICLFSINSIWKCCLVLVVQMLLAGIFTRSRVRPNKKQQIGEKTNQYTTKRIKWKEQIHFTCFYGFGVWVSERVFLFTSLDSFFFFVKLFSKRYNAKVFA